MIYKVGGDLLEPIWEIAMLAAQSGVCPTEPVSTPHMAWMKRLDDLGLALMLLDGNGHEIYCTGALRTILINEPAPWRMQVFAAAKRIAVEQSIGLKPHEAYAAVRPVSDTRLTTQSRSAGAGGYRLRALRLDEAETPGIMTGRPLVLVALEPLGLRLPSTDQLRTCFDLTQREAEVALLLAQRMQNAEVAQTLCISVHTARHHIERVMDKLHVRRRLDIVRLIERIHAVLIGLILLGLADAPRLMDILDIGFSR